MKNLDFHDVQRLSVNATKRGNIILTTFAYTTLKKTKCVLNYTILKKQKLVMSQRAWKPKVLFRMSEIVWSMPFLVPNVVTIKVLGDYKHRAKYGALWRSAKGFLYH